MKSSKKILITASVLITALIIGSMVIIRNDIELMSPVEPQYNRISVDKFDRLDFSPRWIVSITQGIGYKVEVAVEDSLVLKPMIKLADGTLYFSIDTVDSRETSGTIRAKIMTPVLKGIRSVGGTRIHLRNFESDSLTVEIEDRSVFTGVDNKFEFVSFKSFGDARIELTETPDF